MWSMPQDRRDGSVRGTGRLVHGNLQYTGTWTVPIECSIFQFEPFLASCWDCGNCINICYENARTLNEQHACHCWNIFIGNLWILTALYKHNLFTANRKSQWLSQNPVKINHFKVGIWRVICKSHDDSFKDFMKKTNSFLLILFGLFFPLKYMDYNTTLVVHWTWKCRLSNLKTLSKCELIS